MFQKDGSSTFGGKKDAPLRKSDRRRLRDRAVDVLLIGGSENKDDADTDNDNNDQQQEWIVRAEQLINDAIVAGGDILSRKLKLVGGENATLFLRTPSSSSSANSTPRAPSAGGGAVANQKISYDDILKSYPTEWPYQQKTQPVLLEYEDADRNLHLVPLLPLLAALPPPMSSPALSSAETTIAPTAAKESVERRYRIPNIVIHSEVSKFMCRGADLMASGIRSFPSPWELRQSKGYVTISIIGNPQPMAIGIVEHGLFREYCYSKNGKQGENWREQAVSLVGPGKKGVAIVVINCYGDDLWKNGLPAKSPNTNATMMKEGVSNPLGDGIFDAGNFGNVGFVNGERAYPILDMSGGDDESDSEASGDEADDTSIEVTKEGDAADGIAQMSISEENKDEKATGDGSNEENGAEAEVQDEPAEPDHNEILTKAFYTSLILLLSSKTSLPIPVSTYYAKHLLAAVSATGPRLDIKRTTYKKIGPFLLEMESDGVIKLGASKDKKDRCAFLASIVKTNPDLIQFKRDWKKELGATGGDASMAAAASASQQTKMAVVDLFIVPRHVADGMQLDKDIVMATNAKTEERRGTGFLTKKECNALIESYIEQEELGQGKGRVLLNGPLCDALYRVSKKNKQGGQSTEYPTQVKRKELIEKWMGRMDKGHAIVQMPGSKILHLGRGEPKPIDIEVEFRQGNRKKFLTHIRGMEEYGVDGVALSQDVSRRFACSSSVEANPVGRAALKKGRVELVFQGHLSEELTALLTGDDLSCHGGATDGGYNLPKSVFNVVLRKGIPARKKR